VKRAARRRPSGIRRRSVGRHRLRGNQPAVDHAVEKCIAPVSGEIIIVRRLTVPWNEAIDIDHMLDLFPGAVRDACGDHAAVGLADEDDIAQILVLEHRQYILNMGLKVYVAMREMRPFAEACECRRKKFVPPRGHERPHLFPRPASSPTAMGHEKNGQRILLRRSSNLHVAGVHFTWSIVRHAPDTWQMVRLPVPAICVAHCEAEAAERPLRKVATKLSPPLSVNGRVSRRKKRIHRDRHDSAAFPWRPFLLYASCP
jgi:hypothetical protein